MANATRQRVIATAVCPRLRTATAGLFPISIPTPLIVGGLAGVGVLLLVWGIREGAFVLVEARPWRAATALGAAASLLIPSIAMAGGGSSGASEPGFYWEMSDPLGTGMVLVDTVNFRNVTLPPRAGEKVGVFRGRFF